MCVYTYVKLLESRDHSWLKVLKSNPSHDVPTIGDTPVLPQHGAPTSVSIHTALCLFSCSWPKNYSCGIIQSLWHFPLLAEENPSCQAFAPPSLIGLNRSICRDGEEPEDWGWRDVFGRWLRLTPREKREGARDSRRERKQVHSLWRRCQRRFVVAWWRVESSHGGQWGLLGNDRVLESWKPKEMKQGCKVTLLWTTNLISVLFEGTK